MPSLDFFRKLGLFVRPQFLSLDQCRLLQTDIQQSVPNPAVIYRKGIDNLVDEAVRKTKVVDVSAESQRLVNDQFSQLRPELEDYFQLSLKDTESPQFLVYKQGDFFQAHRDQSENAQNADRYKNRLLSLVLFLNGANGPPEPFAGGSLNFYGLIDDPKWERCGFPLIGQPGLLVAFRSHVVHSVEPVTEGTRYTVVSWYR